MRHFFALPLPEPARSTVYELAQEWRQLLNMRASWHTPEDYHITLKFLGNLEEAQQPNLIKAAAPIATAMTPFLVKSAPPGAFPNLRAPEVLWAGVQNSREMTALAERLEDAMTTLGIRQERRRFNANITLARCRLVTTTFQDWPLPCERLFADFVADQFVLMQTLSPEQRAKDGKARYNIVHTFPFGNAPS